MGGRILFIVLSLIAFVVVQSQKNRGEDNGCTKKRMIKYTKEGQISLLCGRKKYYDYPPNENISESITVTDFVGTYVRQNQCKKNKASSEISHLVIGLGAAVGLLSIVLLIVTGGWIWTCWIMRKTTEISIKPKSSVRIVHQYDEHPLQPYNSTSFQPSVKYSLLGPSYNSQLSQLSRSEMEEEQIYEVLDDEDNHLQKAKARGVNSSVTILGDKNGPYSKLEYSENSQSN